MCPFAIVAAEATFGGFQYRHQAYFQLLEGRFKLQRGREKLFGYLGIQEPYQLLSPTGDNAVCRHVVGILLLVKNRLEKLLVHIKGSMECIKTERINSL